MNKINGYTQEEAKSLIDCICLGKAQGKTLTAIFDEYATRSGRARGSVRNYYYSLLKCRGNADVDKLLENRALKAESIKPFTDEETDNILRSIIAQRNRGVSVRRAVLNLSGGDDKLMLRYQNKYRNVLNKQPQRIEKLIHECDQGAFDDGRRQIENKINELYDSLAASLKDENKRLTAIIKKLTDENSLLRLQVKNLQS